MLNKQSVLDVLEKIRKRHCGYVGATCDCKYGGANVGDPSGEQTGCPEIREAIQFLQGKIPKLWGIAVCEDGVHLYYNPEKFEALIKSREYKESRWVCNEKIFYEDL